MGAARTAGKGDAIPIVSWLPAARRPAPGVRAFCGTPRCTERLRCTERDDRRLSSVILPAPSGQSILAADRLSSGLQSLAGGSAMPEEIESKLRGGACAADLHRNIRPTAPAMEKERRHELQRKGR